MDNMKGQFGGVPVGADRDPTLQISIVPTEEMAVIAQRIEDLCVRIDQFGTGATSAGDTSSNPLPSAVRRQGARRHDDRRRVRQPGWRLGLRADRARMACAESSTSASCRRSLLAFIRRGMAEPEHFEQVRERRRTAAARGAPPSEEEHEFLRFVPVQLFDIGAPPARYAPPDGRAGR
jgi:hypothetical protein